MRFIFLKALTATALGAIVWAGPSWVKNAAERGYAVAQYKLGEMYERGRNMPRDGREAMTWYRKSAEQGFGPAQTALKRLSQRPSGA